MKEFVLRFLIGGAIISSFALLADVLRPKSFAGLFGAAPSIALATLGITIALHGKPYVAFEGRSMALGAVAFCAYAYAVCQWMARSKASAALASLSLLPGWVAVALGLRFMLLK